MIEWVARHAWLLMAVLVVAALLAVTVYAIGWFCPDWASEVTGLVGH